MVNRKVGVLINTLESYVGRTSSKVKFLEGIRRVKKADGGAFNNLKDNFSLGANGKLTSNVVIYLEDESSKVVPLVLGFDGLGEVPTSEFNKQLVDNLEVRIGNELESTRLTLEHVKKALVGLVENREEIVEFMTSIWDKETLTKEEEEVADKYGKEYLVSVQGLKSIN